jgi:NAD(P)H-dependent flavin oxidoreductase YrpB (nitropropane dioxygenase family)
MAKIFNSKYPIVAVGMNKVSDITLAIAVAEAGGIPTISCFNYVSTRNDNIFNVEKLRNDLSLFDHHQYDLVISLDDNFLLTHSYLISIFKEYKIKYVEILVNFFADNEQFLKVKFLIDDLLSANIKLLTKMFAPLDSANKWNNYIKENFDGIIVKGSLGAGRVLSDKTYTLQMLTEMFIKNYPDKFIIASGGVGSPVEVKQLIDCGAGAVGIGTLFAASQESILSIETKKRMIESTFKNIETLDTYDLNQNALVFSNIDQNKENNTEGLVQGIKTGTAGHVFAGKGINYINEIQTSKSIIKNLCSLL